MAAWAHGNLLLAVLVGAGAVALPGLGVVGVVATTMAWWRRFVIGPPIPTALSVDDVRLGILTTLYERNHRGTSSRFLHVGRLIGGADMPRRSVARWLGVPHRAISHGRVPRGEGLGRAG